MSITARDIMRTDVQVVSPTLSLADLERRFFEKSVSGFPVVSDEKLVGIVSRSDVVRALCVEQSLSETVTYLYQVHADDGRRSAKDAEEVAERVATRLEQFKVKDVMTTKVVTVSPEASITDIAGLLVKHDIHRVPVTEGGRLLGIISTLDLTRLFAQGRVHIVES